MVFTLAGLQMSVAQEKLGVKIVTIKTGDAEIKVTYPQFTGSGIVVKTANADLLKFANERLQAYRKDLAQMKKDFEGKDIPLRYSYMLEPTISIARPDLISLYFIEYTYTGGAHGMTYFHGRNYGVINGKSKLLALQDLFKPGVDAKKLAGERIYAQLQNNPNAFWVQDGTVTADSPKLTKEFVITPAGVTFLIEQYAVSYYAAGAFFVKVPYAEFGDALAFNY
jgi:hypothetical protein